MLLCRDQQLSPNEFERACRDFFAKYCHEGTTDKVKQKALNGGENFKNQTFTWPDPPRTVNLNSQSGKFLKFCLEYQNDRQFYNQPPGRFVAYALR